MEMHEYISLKKKIQEIFLKYIDDDDENIEEKYQNLIQVIKDQQIPNDDNEFRLLLHLINQISMNHHHTTKFYEKIEKILLTYKAEIQNYLTNYQLYWIFESNKRILLFLIENNILTMNYDIAILISQDQEYYQPNYFIKIIKQFLENDKIAQIEKINTEIKVDYDNFEKNQKDGENEKLFYYMIRKDLISEFIIYVEKNDLSLNSMIETSIFDTNNFGQAIEITLIEYSAYFGSIQIFKYLYKNKANISNSIWKYAVHGNNPELIHFLEENKINLTDKYIKICLEDSIMCHHNEIALYIMNNYVLNKDMNEFIQYYSIDYYNYEFIQIDSLNNNIFFPNLCRCDYFYIIKNIIENKKIDSNTYLKTVYDKDNLYSISKPWQEAVISRNLNIGKLLFESNNIDINDQITQCKFYESTNEKEIFTWHILYFLICFRNFEGIDFIMKYGEIDVNVKMIEKYYSNNSLSCYAETYLLTDSIINNNIKVVEMLLDNPKIDVNIVEELTYPSKNQIQRNSPLFISIFKSNEQILNLLLKHPNIDVNKRIINQNSNSQKIYNSLFYSIKMKNKSIVGTLLSYENIDVNLPSIKLKTGKIIQKNPLHEAIDINDISIIKLLISHPKIDINSKYIYKNSSNLFNYEISALGTSIKKENEEIVQLLLEHEEIDVNYKIITEKNESISYLPILHLAIKQKNYKIVKLLLSNQKIDVNIKSYSKINKDDEFEECEETALECAIVNENSEIIELLLSHPKIDANLKSKKIIFSKEVFSIEEKKPLQIAILQDKCQSLKLIIDHLKKKNQIQKDDLKNYIIFAKSPEMKSLVYKLL